MTSITIASVISTTPIRLSALLSLAVFLSACDGTLQNPASPTSRSGATYTLYGVVWEETSNGVAPLEGALVRDASGPHAVTDAKGQFSIPGLSPSNHTISVTRNGYISVNKSVTITADLQLDLYVGRIEGNVLSGVVFEITEGRRIPIEGVELYCDSCGSLDGHTFVITNADGFYRLEWTSNGVHPLFVTKAGYEIFDPNGTLRDAFGRITATVRGDTVFDVQLVRR